MQGNEPLTELADKERFRRFQLVKRFTPHPAIVGPVDPHGQCATHFGGGDGFHGMHQARIENEHASADWADIDATARRAVAVIPPHRFLRRLELLRFGIYPQGPAVVFWVPVVVEI